jgi:bifunctional non-homologous end joining protein LigD
MPTTTILGALPDAEPIPLLPWREPFDSADWMFEPSYDGFRALLYVSRDGCELRARQDSHFEAFAELRERIARVLTGREAILDGAIVSLDPKGKPVFRELLKGRGYLAFAASDLLWLDGFDLRAQPLVERKRRLAELLPSDTGPLYKVFTLEEHGRALFAAARRMDLEGIVAKRGQDPYESETLWHHIRNPSYRQGEARVDLHQRPARARREAVE